MTNMFRSKAPSKMSPDTFGIGSTISAGKGHNWLVILSPGTKTNEVTLVNLQDMTVSCLVVQVEDVHYLTEQDARNLVTIANSNWTFSDFECHSVGYKML